MRPGFRSAPEPTHIMFIGTRQKTPLLVAGMNAALLWGLVMFHSLDVPLNRFAAHFPRGPNIVAP